MLGQTTRPHDQQAGLDLSRIVRHLVAASASVVGQLQAVERGGRRQGNAAIGGVDPLLSQGIGLVAGGGQQRVQPQPLVIINVFVTQGQSVNALRQHLLDGMLDPDLVAPIVKALRQSLGQPKIGVHLAQEQSPGVGGERASGEIGYDGART